MPQRRTRPCPRPSRRCGKDVGRGHRVLGARPEEPGEELQGRVLVRPHLDPRRPGRHDVALCRRLLGWPAPEYGRLCQGDGGHEGGARLRRTFKSMAASFYRTDLFIRDVTDSGRMPTGGISSAKVRETLHQIQKRHQRVEIPMWMQTYFGFSLLENVEKQCAPMTEDEKRLHLAYMSKAWRIMGMPFSEKRGLMEKFSRRIQAEQAIVT